MNLNSVLTGFGILVYGAVFFAGWGIVILAMIPHLRRIFGRVRKLFRFR